MIEGRDRRALVRELADRAGGTWVTCAGPSMEPTVRVGDRIRIVATQRVRIGDVVLFETADGRDYVLHRVVTTVPGTGYFVHIGDSPACRDVGIAHLSRLVGRADLPRRRPLLRHQLLAARRLCTSAARRALRTLRR